MLFHGSLVLCWVRQESKALNACSLAFLRFMCAASNFEAGFQAAGKQQITQALLCNSLPSQAVVKGNLSCPWENCGLG